MLLASSEQSVSSIRVYSSDEAKRLGVELDPDDPTTLTRRRAGTPSFGSALVESLKKMTAR